VQNEEEQEQEEKNEEIIVSLCSLASWDWLVRFASNLVCRFA